MVEELFEKYWGEYLKFDKIPIGERLHERPDICAMIYLSKLLPDAPGKDIIGASEHDIVFLEWDESTILTDKDVIYLRRCGVHYDSESYSLSFFT